MLQRVALYSACIQCLCRPPRVSPPALACQAVCMAWRCRCAYLACRRPPALLAAISVLLQLMVKKASTRQREARAEETPSLAIEEIVAECHACEALKGKAEPACRRLISMPSQTTASSPALDRSGSAPNRTRRLVALAVAI